MSTLRYDLIPEAGSLNNPLHHSSAIAGKIAIFYVDWDVFLNYFVFLVLELNCIRNAVYV